MAVHQIRTMLNLWAENRPGLSEAGTNSKVPTLSDCGACVTGSCERFTAAYRVDSIALERETAARGDSPTAVFLCLLDGAASESVDVQSSVSDRRAFGSSERKQLWKHHWVAQSKS